MVFQILSERAANKALYPHRVIPGYLEYIPGEYAHRGDRQRIYVHTLHFRLIQEFKGKGYAPLLIEACINDAKTDMKGVAVALNGPFAKKDIFLKNGSVR